MFRDLERNEADSKLFWSKCKRVTHSLKKASTPAPMAAVDGKIVTDPNEVLEVGCSQSSDIAPLKMRVTMKHTDSTWRAIWQRTELSGYGSQRSTPSLRSSKYLLPCAE
jgi:hypothetical protein